MKLIYRNFLMIFRRFRMAMTLNILGLSIAFIAFMAILMKWSFDINFDRRTPHADCIYRIDQESSHLGGRSAVLSRPFCELFIQSSPHIVTGGSIAPFDMQISAIIENTDGTEGTTYKINCIPITEGLPQVFDFDLLEGSTDVLKQDNQALISESMARRMFGNESPIGKSLTIDLTFFRSDGKYQIGGVYRDFPDNTMMQNALYISAGDHGKGKWATEDFALYVRLDNPSSAAGLLQEFKRYVSGLGVEWTNKDQLEDLQLSITSLPELHFLQDVGFDIVPKANRLILYLLFSIAWLILVIAAINFTNFNTALAPVRMKSLNTQRVLGSSVRSLRMMLTAETMLISFFAFLLALLWLYIAREKGLENLVMVDLSLTAHWGLILLTAALSLLLGLVAGLYPAFYMTSFQPALVLKGSFGLSPSGRRLRTLLMSIQYLSSFALIISALFMYLQNRYTQTASLGFDKDAVIVADMSPKCRNAQEVLENELSQIAGVEGIAYSTRLIGDGDLFSRWGREYEGKTVSFSFLPVSPTFLRVMNIPVLEGRDFHQEEENSKDGVVIFNRKAQEQFGIKAGVNVGEFTVAGIIPNFNYASFRKEIEPMALFVGRQADEAKGFVQYNYLYARIKQGTDMVQARKQIETVLRKYDDTYSFDVRFFDQVLEKTYRSEWNMGTLILLFSLLAVFISIVGVFGLVVFDSEYRRREIAVRKVMGSTTTEILILFNSVYFRLLLVCFVLASPLAWYGVYRWLESFAYKTPMYWWVFLLAFLLVTLITIATVTYQNWRAATANPVKSLKSE